MLIYNINTKSYWDNRYLSGDWEDKLGRSQTREFAESQINYLGISGNFEGSLLDFGCGLGDALPVYKKYFPSAKLIGLDISEEAINKCRQKYSKLASFICGTYKDVPKVDIIIASNVFEHLSNDKEIARQLLLKCLQLYIIVPFNENLSFNSNNEHVNTYDQFYFNNLSSHIKFKIFNSKGWGMTGINLYYNIYLKNIARIITGRNIVYNSKQIMFNLSNC